MAPDNAGLAIVPNPLELGADRVVNAVAAWSLLQGRGSPPDEALPGQLVVDLGTATKLDVVSPRGERW